MIHAESALSSASKNPYESKLIGKIGPNMRGAKKKEEQKNLMMIYDRPISAKSNEDRRKAPKVKAPDHHLITEKLGYDMLATNSSAKRRFPSTTTKDDPSKWK